jgi:hypothetical protein
MPTFDLFMLIAKKPPNWTAFSNMKCLLLDGDFFLEYLPILIYAFEQVKSCSEIVDLKTHFSLRIIPVVNQFSLKPSVPTDIVLIHKLNYSVVSDDLFY